MTYINISGICNIFFVYVFKKQKQNNNYSCASLNRTPQYYKSINTMRKTDDSFLKQTAQRSAGCSDNMHTKGSFRSCHTEDQGSLSNMTIHKSRPVSPMHEWTGSCFYVFCCRSHNTIMTNA